MTRHHAITKSLNETASSGEDQEKHRKHSEKEVLARSRLKLPNLDLTRRRRSVVRRELNTAQWKYAKKLMK